MIGELGLKISGAFRKTVPDPFVLAVLLTVVAFVLVVVRTPMSMDEAVMAWAGPDGVWSAGMLKFALQMCLILVTGHALASSPPVSKMLNHLASLPNRPFTAVALVAVVAAVLGTLNWGLGLIAGALMARRVGIAMDRRQVAVHYPLLVAAGYMGLLVWHGGFSGSAPLKVTDSAEIRGIFGDNPPFEALGLTRTILSPMNVFVTGGLIVLVPIVLGLLSPKKPESIECAGHFGIGPDDHEERAVEADKPMIPRLLEDTPIVTVLLVGLIGWWAWRYFFFTPMDPTTGHRVASGLFSLTPDTVNMTMLMLGLICHGTPRRYVRAVDEAARGCSGIILQFPLYAGILGLMRASVDGAPNLTEQLAGGIAAISNETTLPIFTLFSAGLVNLFVPSGGGQWAVQGPIVMQAAADAGVSPGKMVMALAYGDELTNMLQPFWALPLLAITGIKARDIVGYTALVMVFAAVWMTIGLLLF